MSTLVQVLVLLLLGLAGVLALARRRWRSRTASFVERLHRNRPASPAVFSAAELDGLPAPVVRYFRAALREGQSLVRGGLLSQEGDFLVQPEKNRWGPFMATHHFSTQPPGFVWDARIRMAPGMTVGVRDAFLEGGGSMSASLLGLVRLVNAAGTPEIAAGALHRYLAEATWYPTALLPSQGVVWTPIDDSSARATLTAGATTVSLDFRFGKNGLVETVFTPARFRDVDGRSVPTPWQGRFSQYGEFREMLIPLQGEVGWLLPEGLQVYWRGQITEVAYEVAGK